jgi:hypothetical protein
LFPSRSEGGGIGGSGRGTRTPDPRIMIPDFVGLSAFRIRLPSIFPRI